MTQKEKAIEIYEKINDFIYTSNAHFADEDAVKNIALFAVDQIISACEYNHVETWNSEWWTKVKEEIEKYDSSL